MTHKEVGDWGEEIACQHLVSKGYAIVERQWHQGSNEIDIIAMHNGRLAVVEVKTREDRSLDNALAAVDAKKRRRMVTSGNAFVRMLQLPHELQFDVIAVLGKPGDDDVQVVHIPDAFTPAVRSRAGRGAYSVS